MTDVLFVSSSYPSGATDWRGLFIRDLLDALARRDDVSLRAWVPPGDLPATVGNAASPGDSRWLAGLMARGGVAHALRMGGAGVVGAAGGLLWRLRGAYRRNAGVGLYHVNWLQNALPVPADGTPLLVTVLGTDFGLLEAPLVQRLLRRVFRGRPSVVCPNAAWMVPGLQRAFGDVARVRCVPFGIDPGWFAIERARDGGAERWLCVTRLTAAKLGPLLEWGAPAFSGRSRELHLFGPMQEEVLLPDWVHYHGPATPEELRRDWFPTATGLVTLSRHSEGRPQVMLEAMAAGLPIVASALPAHEDLVEHGTSGWICEDQQGFEAGLATLGGDSMNTRIGSQARTRVKRDIGTWDDCAARYAGLYRDLLAAGRDG